MIRLLFVVDGLLGLSFFILLVTLIVSLLVAFDAAIAPLLDDLDNLFFKWRSISNAGSATAYL